jgi:hypothetical protein
MAAIPAKNLARLKKKRERSRPFKNLFAKTVFDVAGQDGEKIATT